MAPLKPVNSLVAISLNIIPELSCQIASESARKIVRRYNRGEDNNGYEVISSINESIICIREYLFDFIPLNLVDQFARGIYQGIRLARAKRKSRYKPSNSTAEDEWRFAREMFVLSEFTALIASPKLISLNDIDYPGLLLLEPIISKLSNLSGLRMINLTSSSSFCGNMKEIVGHKFVSFIMKGLEVMSHLTSFTFHYDCSDRIIWSLSDKCGDSLRKIDVSHCKLITDLSVNSIGSCHNLKICNIEGTNISLDGVSRILSMRTSTLSELKTNYPLTDLEISRQTKLASFRWTKGKSRVTEFDKVIATCPEIQNVTIDYNPINFPQICKLKKLRKLQINDIHFVHIEPILRILGLQLQELTLQQIVDIQIKSLLEYCSNVDSLNLYYSSFLERDLSMDIKVNSSIKRLKVIGRLNDDIPPNSVSIMKLIIPLQNLESLSVISSFSLTDFIYTKIRELNALLNLKSLHLDSNSKFSLRILYKMVESDLTSLEIYTGLYDFFASPEYAGILSNFVRFIRVHNYRVITDDLFTTNKDYNELNSFNSRSNNNDHDSLCRNM